VTAATPIAQSVSEAKPTISAVLATKIEKLIPTERIPLYPAIKPSGETQKGNLLKKFELKCLHLAACVPTHCSPRKSLL
jgi:hypothetical protein